MHPVGWKHTFSKTALGVQIPKARFQENVPWNSQFATTGLTSKREQFAIALFWGESRAEGDSCYVRSPGWPHALSFLASASGMLGLQACAHEPDPALDSILKINSISRGLGKACYRWPSDQTRVGGLILGWRTSFHTQNAESSPTRWCHITSATHSLAQLPGA